ncbi:MAG: glycosyltransferase family 39 protein [Anaerolineales bacterium]|nr:glycosyltransferase family 39 protein [Anaerolineales bacterium]
MADLPPTPSLLDWLTAVWSQPLARRGWRFGLAGLAALAGLGLWFLQKNGAGFGLLALALFLAVRGLQVRGANTWRWPAVGERELPIDAPAAAAPSVPPINLELPAAERWAWVAPLRLPLVFGLAVIGQMALSNEPANLAWGLGLYGLALLTFAGVIRREGLLGPAGEAAPGAAVEQPVIWRWRPLLVAGGAGLAALALSGGNRFTLFNGSAWALAVGAWLAAVYDFRGWRARLAGWAAAVRAGAFALRFSWVGVAVLAALAAGAYFRFNQIDVLPPEMTSDHVEKLLDVADLRLGGETKIFFERNTGREPLQFYWTAWIGDLFGLGISHLALKLGTALIGFFTLPYIFLLGRELEDDLLGLLALALAAVSFWHTAISRVGLRFPLYPVFVAPVLLYLFRGLRRGTRNDFILAGLFLGAGLYGYSPIRVLPGVVAALVGLWLLQPSARGRRLETAAHTLLLLVTALVVFLPLLRYAADRPDLFWERTLSRLSENESAITGAPLLIFLQNNWNALLQFNWRGDVVWVNTLSGRPVLDLFTGAVLVLGAAYALARLIFKRDWKAGALLLAVPLLMLPSTLSLAFPDENPSVVRTGGAIPVVYVLAAYPLWLLVRRARWAGLGQPALGAGAVTLALVLAGAFTLNRAMYFEQYPAQYIGGAQNASEIGQVVHDFANSFGSYDTAWVRPFPYWVDTRAVGMYAGQVYRDYAIQAPDMPATTADPRAKLFILHLRDAQGVRPDGEPATLPVLRQLYPDGRLSLYHSARPDRDFLVFFVPAQPELGEPTFSTP